MWSGASKPALMSRRAPKVNASVIAAGGFAHRPALCWPDEPARLPHRRLRHARHPASAELHDRLVHGHEQGRRHRPWRIGGCVLNEVERRGLTLDQIWITHGHLDHAGGAAEMQEKSGVRIVGPQKADQFWIDRIVESGRMYGLPDARPFTPDRWLDDGDTVSLGETEWEVRHCPGHTPGHVVFFNRAARFAQVGDVLFKGSVGRTDFPMSDPARPDPFCGGEAVAVGRRRHLRSGPRADLDLRRGTPHQSVRVRCGAEAGAGPARAGRPRLTISDAATDR